MRRSQILVLLLIMAIVTSGGIYIYYNFMQKKGSSYFLILPPNAKIGSGNSVMLNGVKAGKIKKVAIKDLEKTDEMIVEVILEPGYHITKNSVAYVKSVKRRNAIHIQLLPGDNYLKQGDTLFQYTPKKSIIAETEIPENINLKAFPDLVKADNRQDVFFSVQVFTSISNKKTGFAELRSLAIIEEDNVYKYCSGNFESIEDAEAYKDSLSVNGFNGSFVVAIQGGKRISVAEARAMKK